jgi:hypothetical protein
MRQAYNGLLSSAVFSVGAYVQGSGDQPPSHNTGMCIAGLKTNGHQLDFINIMSYDAGPTYDPKRAFKTYRDIFMGPILLGYEVGQQAWGGEILSIEEVIDYAKYVNGWDEASNGVFCWAYQKQGPPSCVEVLKKAKDCFGKNVTFAEPIVNVPGIGGDSVATLRNELAQLKLEVSKISIVLKSIKGLL